MFCLCLVVVYAYDNLQCYDFFQDFGTISECERLSLGNSLPALYSSLVEVLSEFEMTELATQQMFNESLCMLKKVIVVGVNKTVSFIDIAILVKLLQQLRSSLSPSLSFSLTL